MTEIVRSRSARTWKRKVAAPLAVLILLVLMLEVTQGDYPVPFREALLTLVGAGPGEYDLVVNRFRFPRALVALLAGAALAVSGAILQGITRNPLAAPGVIGLNAGAALFAVFAIVALPGISSSWLPPIAFAGAFAAAALCYVLAWRRGLSAIRLVLVGVAISAVGGGGVAFLLTFSSIYDAKRAVLWLAGSVYGRSWEHLWPLLPWPAVLFPAAMLLGRSLDALQLGDELAKGLGLRLEWSRGLLLLIAVGLAGSAVATVGTIGFVGLMAPHMARYMVGSASVRMLPVSALTGGLLVMAADLIGRVAFAPIEVPCGILIALLGGPYMILLLYRKQALGGSRP